MTNTVMVNAAIQKGDTGLSSIGQCQTTRKLDSQGVPHDAA